MITVVGRKLVIPEKDSQIGTTYDNNSEVRHIRLNRITAGGVDLANLRFKLDLEYEDAILDTCLLDAEVQEAYILLTWNIPAACVSHKGTVWMAVRAYDENGTIKWATNPGAVYAGHTIFDGEAYKGHLAEFEQLEERITQKAETLDANESKRQEAEEQRKANEERRVNNEAEWQRQAETAIAKANTTLEKATEKAEEATQAARTATAKAEAAEASSTAANRSANTASQAANTATTRATEAERSATAASRSESTASEAARTATTKAEAAEASSEAANQSANTASQAANAATTRATEAERSATAANQSANTASQAAATATNKATEAERSAEEANQIAQGLGGFNGKASSVSAVDRQGLLGEADGTSNVQELLDALAQKVALELVSNSKLAEILSGYIATSSINNTGLVTNEGFVADARQMNPNVAGSLAAKVKKNTDDIVTANSNIEDKIKDAITESDFEFIDVHTLNNFAYGSAVRCGKLVIVCFNTNGTTSTASQGIFFTLPENFWPSENKYGNGVFASSSNTDVNLTNRPVYVDTAGNVYNQSGAAVYRGGGTIAYIK